jgi:hypothetical protein
MVGHIVIPYLNTKMAYNFISKKKIMTNGYFPFVLKQDKTSKKKL